VWIKQKTEECACAQGRVGKLQEAAFNLQQDLESELSAYLKSTVRIFGEIARI